jgi:hypothetical protein
VSEELDNMNAMIGAAALDSGAYWTAVGSELQYPGLATQYCCESGFYPHPEPQPGIAAQWDPISNQIWMNVHHDFGFTQAQWAWLGAHELGHAIGFGHSASTDYSRTIMMHGAMVGGIPGTGLNPRPFEKCSAVQSFSVNIQIGG